MDKKNPGRFAPHIAVPQPEKNPERLDVGPGSAEPARPAAPRKEMPWSDTCCRPGRRGRRSPRCCPRTAWR
jgi:hypothetical protein